jgi:hypothetical protein
MVYTVDSKRERENGGKYNWEFLKEIYQKLQIYVKWLIC